jgi:hypothetical protein
MTKPTPAPVATNPLGVGLNPGDPHYRAFVGPPEDYDLVAAMCFGLLTSLGLRGRHRVLDVGCGSLRLGRLLIPYLNADNYHCGPDLLHQHLTDIFDALTPNGALVATFVEGEADSQASGWVYPGCVNYTAQRMAKEAAACGYVFVPLDWLHPRQRWALFAKPGFDTRWLLGRALGWNTWLAHGPK